MKINEYNQMMKYLTRPARSEPEYEQVAMGNYIKGGKKLIQNLIKKGDVKKGEAPKTDIDKVKSKVESDQKNIQELANEGQIPVKDQTGPKTKTIQTILNADQLRALGRKEGIPEEDVEKFLSGELGLLKRGQGRGIVQRDKEGNIVIKDKYSKKYDPLRSNPVFKQGEVLEDGTPDYEYYRELLDNDEYDVVKGDETVEQLEAMLKEQDDYKKYMYGQYKAGKLGSKIGDDVKTISDTEIAKAFRQAREGNDLDLSDDKYDAQILAEYLSDNLYKTEFSDLPQDAQLDLYDRAYTWLNETKMEEAMRKAKPMKGPIDMKTGKNIITGEKVMDVDYIPGEEPLTPPVKTTPRKDNAEGGLIGGGMIEGEDLGSRTGFAAPKILPKEDLIRLLEEGKTKTEIAKFFETGRNTLDKNIDILISKGELDPSYGKNQIKPTSKRAKLINLINEANSNFKTEKFSKLAEKAGYAKDSDRGTLKNFPKLNTSKENVTKYFDSLMSDLNKPASEFKDILTKVSDHVGVSYETVRTSLKNHENYKINKRALNYVNIPMAQKTVLNPDITFLDIAERFETEGSMRKNSSSKRMSGGYASAEQKIMDFANRHVEQGGNQIEFLTPSNVPDSEKKFKYKGKTYDLETLRLKGPKDPNFKEFYEKFYLSKNIGNKKYKHPLTGKQTPLKEIMAEAYTRATGANILPENVFGLDHSKSVAKEPFTSLRVQDYRTNLLGGTVSKFGELQKLGVLKKEDYTPEKVKFYKKKSGYDFIGNDPDLFVKNQLNLANDIFTKGKKLRQPIEIVKERAASVDDIPTTKSFFNPNQVNMGFGFLDDVTTKIMDDVAKGAVRYGPDVIRGAGTAAKVGAVETGFALPFLRLEEYLGTRPKDALYNIPTLGMYEYFKNRAGGPRRQAFAERQGLGKEYISATEKMKDAVRKFGGVKNEAEILPLMEKVGIGLTDKEKEAYFQVGGSEFDKYEEFRAERQAAENARIRAGLPEIYTKGKDPFSKLIGIPATVMAKSYFGEQEAPPAYDFANGGRVGFEGGGSPKLNLEGIISGSSDKQIIDTILQAEIPISDKIKILGEIGYFGGRFKYGEDEVFKLDELQKSLGLSYNEGGEGLSGFAKYNFDTNEPTLGLQYSKKFNTGGRVEMAGGGIAALKALINFLGKGRGKKGSELLQEVNPKKYGTMLENLMLPDDKKMVGGFRVEYLETLLDTIKNDKAMLDKIKQMPVDQQESFFNMINQGANQGRLDVYKTIDPDEAILEIEQMIKNLKTKDMSPEEIKRSLNAYGGRVGMKIGGDPKDKKKTTPALDKPTIQIDPNAPIDPGRRDFMEKGAGMGVGLGALATGLVKFAPEIKKAVSGVTTQIAEVPNIIKELFFTIKNLGQITQSGKGTVKTKLGPYTLEEGPGGYNITKMTDSDYRYQQEYFEVITDPEKGVIHYEELTALPDMDGKLKDVDYGVDLDTYREIGEDLAKIRKDDKLIKIADDDIAKQIEKEEAFKKSLQKKGTGEND